MTTDGKMSVKIKKSMIRESEVMVWTLSATYEIWHTQGVFLTSIERKRHPKIIMNTLSDLGDAGRIRDISYEETCRFKTPADFVGIWMANTAFL